MYAMHDKDTTLDATEHCSVTVFHQSSNDIAVVHNVLWASDDSNDDILLTLIINKKKLVHNFIQRDTNFII